MMQSDTVEYPTYGYVWFDGGPKRAAAIYGTTNGWAVAVMEVLDAVAVLEAAGNNVRRRRDRIVVDIEGVAHKFPIDRQGMVLFDGGWSLNHEIDRNVGG